MLYALTISQERISWYGYVQQERQGPSGMGPIGKGIFLTKGVGKHRDQLVSFEIALRDARIAEFNIVRVSSIFPPRCKVISIQEGLRYLSPGQVVYAVMYDNATDEPHRLVAASVGLAIPADRNQYGYLSEHKSFGQTDERAGDYAEDLAATMLATILGVEFDPNVSYDERKDIWRLSDKIVTTRNITQSAIGDRDGLWTSVVAAAVFVDLPNGG
jgi:arginine decarboxylase